MMVVYDDMEVRNGQYPYWILRKINGGGRGRDGGEEGKEEKRRNDDI
jgi:hypothetical protein